MSTERRYDPFGIGSYRVASRTCELHDETRSRTFPTEVWYPAEAASSPLVVFSHGTARRGRLQATYLCTHLASHGYIVAALDHSEVVVPELTPRQFGETAEQRAARVEAVIANRVPDVEFLVDQMLSGAIEDADFTVDPAQIGVCGYSFGGWTALAAAEDDWRIKIVVALAPPGGSAPRPGVAPVKLRFRRGRDVPTLYLAAENDALIPLAGMHETFDRTPGTKLMAILRRADHAHFLDDAETEHEALRTMQAGPELAAIQADMRPISELASGEEAHRFTRGLAVCYFDAMLREDARACAFLASDLDVELASRDMNATVRRF